MKVDKTVRLETGYIVAGTLILSVFMEAVFLVIGQWDYTVLLGNLLGGGAAVLNFFLMGLTVQKAVLMNEKDAALKMKSSQSMRTLMLFVVALLGIQVPWFHFVAVLIPLFFPRITITCRGFALKKAQNNGGEKIE